MGSWISHIDNDETSRQLRRPTMKVNLDGQCQQLLQDPSFRLVRVVHGKKRVIDRMEIGSLTVVTPALDPEISKDVVARGWSCLSHLWGDPSSWVDWDDTGVVDAVTGETIKAKVHPDKPEEIMGLLQLMDGYWWIDVFCARSDTPLVIMGDIYKYSLQCTALIGSSSEVFYNEVFEAFQHLVQLTDEHLDDAVHGYLDNISSSTTTKERGWHQILGDVLQWSMNHYNEAAYKNLHEQQRKHATNPMMASLYEILQGLESSDAREDAAREYFKHQSNDYWHQHHGIHPSSILRELRCWNSENPTKAIDLLAEFLSCPWMNRVWTLQELTLPKETRVTPPWIRRGSSTSDQSVAGFQAFQSGLHSLLKVVAKAYDIQCHLHTEKATETETELKDILLLRMQSPRELLSKYERTDPVLAQIYGDYRKIFEVVITIGPSANYSPIQNMDDSNIWKLILNSMATSQRRALYPVDYVYGVLGILNIDIPRLDDPKEVWRVFSTKLQARYREIHVPRNVDLSKATKMADVYGNFGFTSENFISTDNIEYTLFGYYTMSPEMNVSMGMRWQGVL